MGFGHHALRGRILPILALVLGGLAAASAGCGGEEARQRPGEEQPPSHEALSDAQIARVVSLINTGEVEHAQIVLGKLKNADVRAFAQKMLDEHTATEKKLTDLVEKKKIKQTDSALARHLKENADAKGKLLRESGKPEGEYDTLYLDTQIQLHRNALDVLDRQLVPQVKDKELADFLTETRAHVEEHLKEAEKLRRQIGPNEGRTESPTEGR